MTQTLNIKPGDLVKNIFRYKMNMPKSTRHGIILSNYFKEDDWFYVLCEGKKERWHISNIDLL